MERINKMAGELESTEEQNKNTANTLTE